MMNYPRWLSKKDLFCVMIDAVERKSMTCVDDFIISKTDTLVNKEQNVKSLFNGSMTKSPNGNR